jgi:Xaa-Pro dipeptidase
MDHTTERRGRWGATLPFPESEYRDRQARVREEMGRRDIEVLLLVAPESLLYLTGFDSIEYFSYQMLFVPRDEDRVVLLTRPPEEWIARDISIADEVVTWRVEFPPSPVELTIDVLRTNGWLNRRLALEKAPYYLSVANHEALRRGVGRDLEDAVDIVPELRMRKSAKEIEYVREAARIADLAVQTARDVVRPGMTEFELQAAVLAVTVAEGSEYTAVPDIIGSGWRSALPHATPSHRRIESGEAVSFETAGVVHRYHATIGRTLSMGPPSDRLRSLHAIVEQAVDAAVAAARPGAPVGDVDRAAKAVIAEAGYERYRIHRTGYGISAGYPPSWLENLNIIESDSHVLEPGMVFSIEPPIMAYDEGIGIKLIDDFLMTETTCVCLSRLPRELIVV